MDAYCYGLIFLGEKCNYETTYCIAMIVQPVMSAVLHASLMLFFLMRLLVPNYAPSEAAFFQSIP